MYILPWLNHAKSIYQSESVIPPAQFGVNNSHATCIIVYFCPNDSTKCASTLVLLVAWWAVGGSWSGRRGRPPWRPPQPAGTGTESRGAGSAPWRRPTEHIVLTVMMRHKNQLIYNWLSMKTIKTMNCTEHYCRPIMVGNASGKGISCSSLFSLLLYAPVGLN